MMLMLGCLCSVALAHALQLDCYSHPDKALTVYAGGDFVDPYFAHRALITAHQIGSDIRPVADGWIEWALQHQLADGRFARYCSQQPGQWRECAEADADDAVLALWQQLLYLVSAETAFRGKWQGSMHRAQQQLAVLLDDQRGVYQISRSQPTGLFMDNVEIYDALTTIAAQQESIGAKRVAGETAQQATRLAQAINRVFWLKDSQRYAVATQDYKREKFYPHIVAQIYPWLFDLSSPVHALTGYQRWHAQHAERWLSFKQDKYPWGMIAAAADKLGDTATARRWLTRAGALRDTERWNILEEAIFQALSTKYGIPVSTVCPQGSP